MRMVKQGHRRKTSIPVGMYINLKNSKIVWYNELTKRDELCSYEEAFKQYKFIAKNQSEIEERHRSDRYIELKKRIYNIKNYSLSENKGTRFNTFTTLSAEFETLSNNKITHIIEMPGNMQHIQQLCKTYRIIHISKRMLSVLQI